MSTLAWNCRGLGKPRVVQFLKEITQQIKPNIIFLSETLAKENKVKEVCKQINFAGYWAVEAQGHSGGLALLWKNNGSCQIRGSGTQFIDFEVENDQVGRWCYTGYYGCPERSRRRVSWDTLRGLAGDSTLPWCILGDFNDMLFSEEKRGGREQPAGLLRGFTKAIDDCGLLDLGFVGEKFTWERWRGTASWVQERLDRAFANHDWKTLFPQAELRVLEVSTSDHLPIFLQLHKQVYIPKKRRFKFENVWLLEDEWTQIVKNGWDDAANRGIMEKVMLCGVKLQEWGRGSNQEFKEKIKVCRERLRKLRARRDNHGVRLYNEARWEFLQLLEKQEIYWKQRAKQFWLKEGDQNTRFFHKYASQRNKTNLIARIKDDSGQWCENLEDIQKVIENYFSNLFTASSTNGQLSQREEIKRVSEQENIDLVSTVTEEEVKHAVFSMHPDKSPGLDGFNPAFYQFFWNIVKKDVIQLCQKFMCTGEFPEGMNRTLVCLIPKIKVLQTMADLRPISLCNVLVRILSKVLSNRLKVCLGSIISDRQSAFIEGRLLTDNALVAFEVNHYMKRKTRGKHGVAGLKIDISKAYDRL